MLIGNQILQMLVVLREVGDLELAMQMSVSAVVCRAEDRPKLQEMASIIQAIYGQFTYEDSPEFAQSLAGKSESAQRMQRKMLTPEKRKNAQRELGTAITALLDSDRAYQFVPAAQHPLLDRLRALAKSVGA